MPTDEESKKLQEQLKNAKSMEEAEKLITDEVEKRIKMRKKELETMNDLKDYSQKIQYEADLGRMLNDRISQQNTLFELNDKIDKLRQKAIATKEGSEERTRFEEMTNTLINQAKGMEALGIKSIKTTEATKRFANESDSMFSDLAS